ncbi:hypothetical protein B566_EDAN015638 [Ephemera danica]|nr:hypothetical protein B566_EDAN015638 [Ephemera danica]
MVAMSDVWKIKNLNRQHTSFNVEKEWNGPFYFVQGADCQLGLIERYIERLENPGWKKEIALTKLAVEKINNLNPKPKFFVICGDLCDAFPTETPELRAQQEADLKAILKQIDPEIPLVCVCGNHDVGDIPTNDYYSFWCGGVLCLVVNSQLWANGTQVPELAAAQDKWLEQQLQEIKQGVSHPSALIFQHIPWFLNSPDEPATEYFTLKPDVRNNWLPKFKAAGWYEDMEVVTTSAIGGQLGTDLSGMRLVKVLSSGVEHQYHSLHEFPSQVTL